MQSDKNFSTVGGAALGTIVGVERLQKMHQRQNKARLEVRKQVDDRQQQRFQQQLDKNLRCQQIFEKVQKKEISKPQGEILLRMLNQKESVEKPVINQTQNSGKGKGKEGFGWILNGNLTNSKKLIETRAIDVSSDTFLLEEINLPDSAFIFVLCYTILGGIVGFFVSAGWMNRNEILKITGDLLVKLFLGIYAIFTFTKELLGSFLHSIFYR